MGEGEYAHGAGQPLLQFSTVSRHRRKGKLLRVSVVSVKALPAACSGAFLAIVK